MCAGPTRSIRGFEVRTVAFSTTAIVVVSARIVKLADEAGRATADFNETGLDRGARLFLGGGIPR